jgi:hypothetical protein
MSVRLLERKFASRWAQAQSAGLMFSSSFSTSLLLSLLSDSAVSDIALDAPL